MNTQDRPLVVSAELLDVGYEIGVRPQGASRPEDLALALRGIHREAGRLVVLFDPASLEAVPAFATAEQRCCEGIGRAVEEGDPIRLLVSAGDAHLDVLAQVWKQPLERAQG